MDANPNGSGLSDDAATQAITGLLDQGMIRTDDEEDVADDTNDQAAAPQETEAEDDEGEEDAEAEEADGEEESEDADEDDDSHTEPKRFTVKINGKEQQVTREELIAGYQMGEDYRQKTMKLAEDRRALEAEANQARQYWMQMLQQAQQQVQLDPLLSRTEEQWNKLREEDPVQYAADSADYNRRMQAAQQRQAVMSSEMERQRAAKLEQEREALASALPEWSDDIKRKEIVSAVYNQAKAQGFTDAEINNAIAYDHRAFLAIWKAAQYDALRSRKAAVEKKVEGKPKVQKPMGARNKVNPAVEAKESAMKRLRKSGSDRDATAAFLNVL